MHPKLEFKNISHAFTTNAKTPLFDDLTLKVAQGSVASIVGASGVGKSTLFNIAAGLIYPSHGQVMIDGKNVTGTTGHVGYMLQKTYYCPIKRFMTISLCH